MSMPRVVTAGSKSPGSRFSAANAIQTHTAFARSCPLLSVVMPVYNGRAFFADTLSSVDRQSYPRVEKIAVDDGSTDGSLEALDEHGGWRLHAVARLGSNGARRAAIDLAHGDYIAFLDQDDFWHPNHLSCCVRALEQCRDAPAAVGRRQRFRHVSELRLTGHAGRADRYDPWDSFPFLLIDTPSMVVVRRDALDAIGGWPTEGGAAADWLAWWRLACHGAFLVTPSRTVGYRESAGAMTAPDRRTARSGLEDLRGVVLEALQSLPAGRRELLARHGSALMDAVGGVINSIEKEGDIRTAAVQLEASLEDSSAPIVLLTARFIGWLLAPMLQRAPAAARRSLQETLILGWPLAAARTRSEIRRMVATVLPFDDLLTFAISRPWCSPGWRCLGESSLWRVAGCLGRIGDPLDIRFADTSGERRPSADSATSASCRSK